MVPTNSRRKLIFLHNPRTGGTTLQAALRAMYPGSYHYCRDSDPRAVREAVDRFDCVELHAGDVKGQMVFMNEHVMDETHWPWLNQCLLFVMFRRPVTQVISSFRHLASLREHMEPYYQRRKIPFPANIREWLASPLARNLQLAFLLGNLPVVTGRILQPADLEAATRLLDRLEVIVGLTEKYDESLHVLERMTGRTIPDVKLEIKNRPTPNTVAVTEATRDFIARMNPLDDALYDDAMHRFEQRLTRVGPCTRSYCA